MITLDNISFLYGLEIAGKAVGFITAAAVITMIFLYFRRDKKRTVSPSDRLNLSHFGKFSGNKVQLESKLMSVQDIFDYHDFYRVNHQAGMGIIMYQHKKDPKLRVNIAFVKSPMFLRAFYEGLKQIEIEIDNMHMLRATLYDMKSSVRINP